MLTVSTITKHEPLAGIVAPVRAMLVADGGALTLTLAPPQVVLAFGIRATARPLGKLSVRLAAVNGAVLGLLIVMLSVAGLPGVTDHH